MNCTKCGNEISGEGSFCPVCGESAKREEDRNAPEAFRAENKKKTRRVWIISACFALAALILIATFIFAFGADSPEQTVDHFLTACLEGDSEAYFKSSIYADEVYRILFHREINATAEEKNETFEKTKEEGFSSFRIEQTEYFDDYEDIEHFDIDAADLSEAEEFAVVLCELKEGDQSRQEEFKCIKLNGKWYVFIER